MADTLYDRERLFKHAFYSAPIGKLILTLDGRILEVNPSLCRTVGYAPEELIGRHYGDITHPDDRENDWKESGLENGAGSRQITKRYIHKSGQTVWAQVQLSNIREESGTPVYVVAQVQDMTEKRRTESLLKKSEQMYRSLFENHPDMIFTLSLEGRLLSCNPAAAKATGYAEEELFGLSSARGETIMSREDIRKYAAYVASVREGRCADFEMSMVHKNGNGMMLQIKLIPMIIDEEVQGVFGIAQDVTEYKQAAQALRETERLYRLIAENAQDLITVSGPDGRVTYISPNAEKIIGYSAMEIVGRPTTFFWHPEDEAAVKSAQLLRHADQATVESRVICRDGRCKWFETRVNVVRDAAGHMEKIIGIGRDITERKQAGQEAREREESYRRLVEESPDAVAVSINRQWTYINNAVVQMFGGESKEQLLRIPSYNFVHPDSVELNKMRMRHAENGGTARVAEQKLLRLNGEPFDAETVSIPVVYQGRPAVHTIIRDVTHRKEEQSMLMNSEKLHIAGQLAAGIAHEIRNPLTAIKGFIKLMKQGPKDEYFEIISAEILRMEQIITELLLLAKPSAENSKVTDVVQVVRQTVAFMESEANMRGIVIETTYKAESAFMNCDGNKLKQALINFIKNAMDAMPDGGEIAVSADEEEERQLRIRIADQGSGIPRNVLARLGQPFTTTKEKGTGLGFMVSKSIIEGVGGKLAIRSDVGQGTTVDVLLPATAHSSCFER